MAINIQHTYTTHVDIHYYCGNGYGYVLHSEDCDNMDNIAERVCRILVKHNFSYADVCSAETGEVLMKIERS